MDLVTQTSLEALLLKATHSKNLNFDTAAVEAFCTLVNKEKDGIHIGVKVIAARLPAGDEKEMLQTLNILDHCMSKCGTPFQNEVGKFRFLNELIKLVSPKYLGSQTPLAAKQKILQLLYVWTLDYPKETKIIEAFDMLRKQGVVREIPNPNIPTYESVTVPKRKLTNSVFQDEEKSKILQKLLQSKDPEDVQAANWLIKSMVKEDDKRAELKSKKTSELESAQNNVRLLNEMLDSYKPGVSSEGELDLIKELYQNCERLKPSVNKLVLETHQEEGLLDDILKTNDELTTTFQKYNNLIVLDSNEALLQFDIMDPKLKSECDDQNSTVDVLCDIFSDSCDVLQPVTEVKKVEKTKLTGFEELDALGHILIKENLHSQQINRSNTDKIPMNLLGKVPEVKQTTSFDLTYLLNSHTEKKPTSGVGDASDDCLVDISDVKMLECDSGVVQKSEIKLNDVNVKLESIKPSGLPPLIILDDKNRVSVTLHLAKDEPKQGVKVFVLTTVSKNEAPLTNYLFQAVVPKGCKLRLQAPSSTDLPVFNPFLPPAAITQIMLIATTESLPVSLKFIISYVLDDETVTEMGEVERLPSL